MSRRKNPPKEPFRRMQAVSPVPSKRRYAKRTSATKTFMVYATNTQTGEDMHAIPIFAVESREAILIAKKRLFASPLLRNTADVVFTAVEIEE